MHQHEKSLTFLSHADILAHSDVFAPGLLDYPSISIVFSFPHLLQQEQLKINMSYLIFIVITFQNINKMQTSMKSPKQL